MTRAPADNVHPPFHGEFAKFSQRRIAHPASEEQGCLPDVRCRAKKADKLVAGYTFFEPYARSWPPHNHTDQEEVYIFLNGRGSMEVYESPETLSFVHNVGEGDAVTIPMLNYHPVFAQEKPLEFIWCIAGERYWVGDKNKDFMKGARRHHDVSRRGKFLRAKSCKTYIGCSIPAVAIACLTLARAGFGPPRATTSPPS